MKKLQARATCFGSCTEPKAVVKKGAPPNGGKEKGKLAGKTKGVAKEKAAVSGRGGHGVAAAGLAGVRPVWPTPLGGALNPRCACLSPGGLAVAPLGATVPAMATGAPPPREAMPVDHEELHPAGFPPLIGGCLAGPTGAPRCLQQGTPMCDPVPTSRERDPR